MTGPTHIAFGLATGLTITNLTGAVPATSAAWLALAIGAVFPDIDSPSSTISKPGAAFKRFLPKFLVEVLNECGAIISFIVRRFSKHRGASHWPAVGLIIIALGVYYANSFLVWFGIGYLSHILADFCTKGGVPIFGPFATKPVSWSPLVTGSFAETLVMLGLWIFVTWSGFKHLPEETKTWLENYWLFFSRNF